MEMRLQDFDSVALFNQALEAHNAGDLNAAEQIYKETLAIQPDHCEANHNIGIVLVAKNELDKALEFFKLALTASPNVSLFWASYIDTLAKLERIIEAKALIKAARNSGMACENIEAISQRLDIENQEPLAKNTREIDEFITQQKFDDAIGACLNLLETYPSSAILNITLGKCYFELGRIDLAISSYTKATEYWPQSEVSYAMLGQIYSSQGDTEQAIKNLSKAVELKPDDHELHSLLGVELTQNGDVEAAIATFQQALKIKPDYAEAYNGIGTVFMKKGDLGAAVDSYKQALKIKPDYADAYFGVGNALKDKGDLDAAIDSYKQALKIKPDFADAYNNMGNVLRQRGDLEAAIESFKQVLKIKPDDADAYNNMAVALDDMDYFDAAIENFKKALKISPNYYDAYNNMGNTLKNMGNTKAAIEAYQDAINLEPSCAEAYSNLGYLRMQTGDTEAAIEAYKQTIKIKPYHVSAQHLLAALTGQKTASAPNKYIEGLFDGYAVKFEHSLVDKLEYKFPNLIAEVILKLKSGAQLRSMLDLGCGTGLVGVELRELCQNIEGIDLSKKMLIKASQKNVYDKLSHTGIVEYLSEAALDFDLFIAADVFVYVGDLSGVFRLIKSRNKRKGWLAFSTEHTEKDGFFLRASGRYSHSKSYIESLCSEFDYQALHFSKADLRKEEGEFLTGGLYVLKF